jgi:outer membrane receptor protein involved in Fe transport
MHKLIAGCAVTAILALPVTAYPSTESDIAELKAMFVEMKTDYERRIADLENRLEAAEKRAVQAERKSEVAAERSVAAEKQADKATQRVVALDRKVEATPTPGPTTASSSAPGEPTPRNSAVTSASAFNPRMSVILDGNYYNDGLGGEGAALVGEAFQPELGHGHEHDEEGHDDHGHATTSNGFNFREAEFVFSATVDPYFDANAMVVVDGDGNVDLEEAWFQTRNLPHGLKVKGGKFLSDFGYINNQHPHQWDFADQNLAYLNLLGDHGLQETGLQLTWLPETPVYTLLGIEAGQGNQERLGVTLDDHEQAEFGLDDTKNGPRLWTAFAKIAPDLGDDHALRFGVSYARNNQHQGLYEFEHEEEEDHAGEEEHGESGYEGSAGIWGLDLVYKYDGDGDHGHRDFKLQTEYLRSTRNTTVRSGEEDVVGRSLDFTTDGLYVQGVYGIFPKLRAGLRYDVFGLTNKVSGAADESFGSSDRWTANLTWDLSEYSRLRAQYARSNILVAEDERERFDAFYLQFLMSLGSHGAHKF